MSEYRYIIGCDEVGRGSLVGPVVAAAAAFQSESSIKNLVLWMRQVKDSKLLKPAKREELDLLIKEHAVGWAIGEASCEEIDNMNIHHATLLAMKRAVDSLLQKISLVASASLVMVDGKFTIPGILLPQEAVVDGDAKVFAISAASIVAKVYRDDLMAQLHEKLPEYNFAKHKGYGTREHCEAIKKHGLSPMHRQTFCKNIL